MFLFYGDAPEDLEAEADLTCGLTQDSRSMFYHRDYGAGVSDFENAPDGLSLQVGMKYRVADWVARNNLEVSDGSNGTRDRRVLVSQGSVQVEPDGGGKLVRVLYLRYADLMSPKVLAVPLGA